MGFVGPVTGTRKRLERMRKRLARFYACYDPSKLCEVNALCEKYAARSQELFVRLVDKYGPEPRQPFVISCGHRARKAVHGKQPRVLLKRFTCDKIDTCAVRRFGFYVHNALRPIATALHEIAASVGAALVIETSADRRVVNVILVVRESLLPDSSRMVQDTTRAVLRMSGIIHARHQIERNKKVGLLLHGKDSAAERRRVQRIKTMKKKARRR